MILVTGATGFLGQHLIPSLLSTYGQVRALIRPSASTTHLQTPGVEIAVASDITDVSALTQAATGCDTIIHAAGLFRFWGQPKWFWDTNVRGTEAVITAARQAGVRRILHISTIAVIGRTPAGLIDESTPCQPLDPYQASKLAAEEAILAAHRSHNLDVIIIRPGAFYGPHGEYAFNRLFFTEPLRGWRIKVSNGRHITFPVFVPDVVQGIILALKNGRSGETYNFCGPCHSHNTINAIVSDLAGISRWRLNIPRSLVLGLAHAWTAVSHLTHREPFYPRDMAPYVFQDWRVSSAKAIHQLGFSPTPFEQGARLTLEWYRNKRHQP